MALSGVVGGDTCDVLIGGDLGQQSGQHGGVAYVNRPGFTGGQNSRRIAHYGTDIKEENLEAIFT